MLLGLLALKKNLFATFRIDFTVNYEYVINNIIGKFLLKAIGFESPLTHTHTTYLTLITKLLQHITYYSYNIYIIKYIKIGIFFATLITNFLKL